MRSLLDSARHSIRRTRRSPARGITLTEFGLVLGLVIIVLIPIVTIVGGSINDHYSEVDSEVRNINEGGYSFPQTVDTATFDTDAVSDAGIGFPVTWDDGTSVAGWTSGGHMVTSGTADSGRWSVAASHEISVTMFGVGSGGADFSICRFNAASGGAEDCITPVEFAEGAGGNALANSPAAPAGYNWIGIRFSGAARYDDVIITNVGP